MQLISGEWEIRAPLSMEKLCFTLTCRAPEGKKLGGVGASPDPGHPRAGRERGPGKRWRQPYRGRVVEAELNSNHGALPRRCLHSSTAQAWSKVGVGSHGRASSSAQIHGSGVVHSPFAASYPTHRPLKALRVTEETCGELSSGWSENQE